MVEALTLRMANAVELPSWRQVFAWLRSMIVSEAPVTLAEELTALGVATIDLNRVLGFQARMVWERRAVGAYAAKWDRHDLLAFRGEVPADARRSAERASTIPGAKVVVETFDQDPFLKVVRSTPRSRLFSFLGSEKEEACIACWDTDGFDPNE